MIVGLFDVVLVKVFTVSCMIGLACDFVRRFLFIGVLLDGFLVSRTLSSIVSDVQEMMLILMDYCAEFLVANKFIGIKESGGESDYDFFSRLQAKLMINNDQR